MNAKLRLDPFQVRWRIRNGLTGGYIHITLFRILEFPNKPQAEAYISRAGLSRRIYHAEAVRHYDRD